MRAAHPYPIFLGVPPGFLTNIFHIRLQLFRPPILKDCYRGVNFNLILLSSSKNALKRRLSKTSEPRKESIVSPASSVTSVTPISPVTPVRVAVVLSQGGKVLTNVAEEKHKGTGWNKWFKALGKVEGKYYFTVPLR